ncbi:MAG: tetratricopeptide repeat protein [Caldilineales bacterium]|nr:tetratricopeptide repeat protein [Caldilineales bacterium]
MTATTHSELDAIMALAQTDLKEARKALRRIVPTLPDAAAVHTALGLTYMALEQPRDAVRAFKQAIERDPGDPLPRYHLGAHQTDLGLLPHGEENLRIAAAAEPENARYQAALGFNYFRANKRASAIAALEQAAAAGSEDDEVFASLGYLYYGEERLQEAADAFSRGLEYNPAYHELYNNRGYLRLLLGDLAGAQADMDACIAADATFLRARYNRALLLWLQGDPASAKEAYSAARGQDKADAELKQHLSDFDEIERHHPEAGLGDLRLHLAVAQKAARR